MLKVKRVYEKDEPADGTRYLVERLWPRGMKKENLKMEAWLKDVAPSSDLRKWFSHDPAKWVEFQKRYRAELESNPSAWKPILDVAKGGMVTLLFSSHDAEHNNAIVLKSFLDEKLQS